jgi:hypothetical protein
MFYLSFRISNSKKAFNIKILLTKSTVSLSLLSSGEKKYHHICLEFYMGLNPNYFGSILKKRQNQALGNKIKCSKSCYPII